MRVQSGNYKDCKKEERKTHQVQSILAQGNLGQLGVEESWSQHLCTGTTPRSGVVTLWVRLIHFHCVKKKNTGSLPCRVCECPVIIKYLSVFSPRGAHEGVQWLFVGKC